MDESHYQELVGQGTGTSSTKKTSLAPQEGSTQGQEEGPSLDDVNEAAKASLRDKILAPEAAKKMGKPSGMEEDDLRLAIAEHEQAIAP